MTGKELIDIVDSPKAAETLSSLYGEEELEPARKRYRRLIEEFLDESVYPKQQFPETKGELRLFSVPGRTELGGNHTDHNRGKVLAASVHLDAAAAAAPRHDKLVFFRSVGHRDVKVNLTDLSPRQNERGETEALIRGIAADFTAQGTPVGGFTANAYNMVLTGSGLSSSAAVELLFAKIFDNLYCGGKRDTLELAKTGQRAENNYFGKPCGLMDQIACASGGAVAIDFHDSQNPSIRKINFDLAAAGYTLCVIDTKGKHSDLTADYAAIPKEMMKTAAFFGKAALRDLDEETFMARIPNLRKALGDRALLRSFHFFSENRRVASMLQALENGQNNMNAFLALVRESGESSSEFLQNIYSTKNPAEQGISLALALTKRFLKGGGGICNGACRVHGGGFAGTIQAYIPRGRLEAYRNMMEGVFGKGTFTVLRIRPLGAVELDFLQH